MSGANRRKASSAKAAEKRAATIAAKTSAAAESAAAAAAAAPKVTTGPWKRRGRVPDVVIDPTLVGDDDEDDDDNDNIESEEEITTPASISGPAPTPAKVPMIYHVDETPTQAKHPKLGGNAPTSVVMKPLIQLCTFHYDMKTDIEKPFNDKEDISLRVNFHVHISGWDGLDISKINRQNWIQAAFGITRAQMTQLDKEEEDKHVRGLRPLGIVVSEQIRKYNNTLNKGMREQFLCLLKMLFECPKATQMLQSILVGVEGRGARAINDNYSIVEQEEINDVFVKGDIYLVANVWSPVLDVVEKDYLLTAPDWSAKFLRQTCVTLAWLLTYFLKTVDNPRLVMKDFNVSICNMGFPCG